MTSTRANISVRARAHLFRAARIVAGLCLMATGLAVSGAPAGGTTPTISGTGTHAGTLTATGVCPYDYEYDTFGQSWQSATYSGTLTGFAPKTTYYVYDLTDEAFNYSPVPVTANAHGTIRLDNRHLDIPGRHHLALPGPDQMGGYPISVKTIPISISTKNGTYEGSPPAGQIYRPKTTLLVNPACNPSTAAAGTTIMGDGTSQMASTNRLYFFGENPTLPTGAFELTQLVNKEQVTVVWSTNTTGSSNNIVMQKDGNLVVYGNGKAIWQSHTYGHPGAYLVLQPDRNLVIYSAGGKALWQSGTDIR
jgi:hypothetical protein